MDTKFPPLNVFLRSIGRVRFGVRWSWGGVILNPILIAFEVFPQVAFSTSMYLALYSSLANTILFYLAGFIFVD